MWKIAAVALLAACGPVKQPDSLRTVAAVEIPARTGADRDDLVAMLRRHATGGLHVDDVSEEWLDFERQSTTVAPEDRGTIFVGVWRGDRDEHQEIDVGDRDHPGLVWATFLRGPEPERAARVRRGLLDEIHRRWPEAKALPVLPSGGLPLREDLRMTPAGYRIARSAAPGYELAPSSPLVGGD
jgi:hypothetical protein